MGQAVSQEPKPEPASDANRELDDFASGDVGERVPVALRTRAEQSLGTNLSGVRVRHDATSQRLAGHHRARAFSVGDSVGFGSGHYQSGG